jgi:hypothetical protein
MAFTFMTNETNRFGRSSDREEPMKWIAKVASEIAKRLRADTFKTESSIAFATGFQSPDHQR